MKKNSNTFGPLTFKKLTFAVAACTTMAFTGCGSGYLDAEEVRAHLDAPSGSVSSDSMPHAGDDFFKAQRADRVNVFANNTRVDSRETSEEAAGFMGGMNDAVLGTQMATAGDVLCAAGLVTQLNGFDGCEDDANCEVEVTINSCVLRAGGDEHADGKLYFRLKNETDGDYYHSELEVEFSAFEFTSGDRGQFIEGILAVDLTEDIVDGTETAEVILSADVLVEFRGFDGTFWDDDVQERARTTVALRFRTTESDALSTGSLEILAFVDESDDSRDESVVISFEAESRRISENQELAGATLSVRGTNGSFDCTWNTATETNGVETSTYDSEGECIDADTGEVFNWDSTATYTNL